MPLRVRCRCGQELNLKYSEWVYVGIVLVLFAILANTTALIVLLVHVKDVGSALSDAASGPTHAAPGPQTVEDGGARESVARHGENEEVPRSPSPGSGEVAAEAESPEGGQTPAEGPANDAEELADDAGSEEEGAAAGATTSAGGDGAAEPSPSEAEGPGEPSPYAEKTGLLGLAASKDRQGETSAVDTLLEELRLRRGGARSETEKKEAREKALPAERPVHEGGPLIRLLILRQTEDDLLLTAAFFLDPEPLIRREAMGRVLEHLSSAGLPSDPSLRRRLEHLAENARNHLRRAESGQAILELLGGSGKPAVEKVPVPPERSAVANLWAEVESRAANRLARLPGSSRLAMELGEIADRGTDILLLVDTTKSMEGAIGDIQRTASWLFPSLEWGAPGSRVGLLLYKDEVEEIVNLSSRPGRDVLPRLLDIEAAGGGDVPEGVFVALKTALELGRIDWRDEAEKHIVIIGDQPSPYDQKRAFESLASASHEQGGFRIHTLGMASREGEAVPFFADFARAGGGRHALCAGDSLGVETLVCMLDVESRPLAEELSRALEPLFTSGG